MGTKRLLRPPSYSAPDFEFEIPAHQQPRASTSGDSKKEEKLNNLIKTCVAAGLSGNAFVKVMSAFMIYFNQPEEEFISRRTYSRKKEALFKVNKA